MASLPLRSTKKVNLLLKTIEIVLLCLKLRMAWVNMAVFMKELCKTTLQLSVLLEINKVFKN